MLKHLAPGGRLYTEFLTFLSSLSILSSSKSFATLTFDQMSAKNGAVLRYLVAKSWTKTNNKKVKEVGVLPNVEGFPEIPVQLYHG